MKIKEMIKLLKNSRGSIDGLFKEEIIQCLREYDELKTILHEILDKLEEAYLVYRGDSS